MNTQNLIAKPNEHAFAPFVRILGKGKTGSRSLTREEARIAMGMILRGEVKDVQLGAFLMLLRVKEESAEELTGFVEAARATIHAPTDINVDLDWSSYAGKRKHLPWFLLSALALADRGIRVFLHGAGGHTKGRIYTESVLNELGVTAAENWTDVEQALDKTNFTFMPLRHISPPLQVMIDLRNDFGLRSPVHTLTRLLNPLSAPYSIQSVFHPPYALRHQQAAIDLGQLHASVFKGEGGEVERKPEALTKVFSVHNGVMSEDAWPKMIEGRQEQPEELDIEHLRKIWSGTANDEYAEMAIVGTLAIALRLLQKAEEPAQALALAQDYWQQRNRDRIS
ncbi:MAG: glycosyl transferase [Verrucomicrobiaceae bacterium]|nr:glycosyl transferase [Verrucomicrobiaceae bacterium]